MIYITLCPKCKEAVAFLENEDTKICRNCREVVTNFSRPKENNKKKEKE